MTKFAPLRTVPEEGPPRAWLLDVPARMRAEGLDPKHDATVSSWIVSAPWAHPFWSDYWVYLCHLRPIDRGDGPIETKNYLEGATHEMWVAALDPGVKAAEHGELLVPRYLTPMNFGAQMIYPSDQVAAQHIEGAVRDVLERRLNPDTDFRRQWIARFGDNMIKRPSLGDYLA